MIEAITEVLEQFKIDAAVTGFVRGTITPFGTRTPLPVVLDASVSGPISLGGGAHVDQSDPAGGPRRGGLHHTDERHRCGFVRRRFVADDDRFGVRAAHRTPRICRDRQL